MTNEEAKKLKIDTLIKLAGNVDKSIELFGSVNGTKIRYAGSVQRVKLVEHGRKGVRVIIQNRRKLSFCPNDVVSIIDSDETEIIKKGLFDPEQLVI